MLVSEPYTQPGSTARPVMRTPAEEMNAHLAHYTAWPACVSIESARVGHLGMTPRSSSRRDGSEEWGHVVDGHPPAGERQFPYSALAPVPSPGQSAWVVQSGQHTKIPGYDGISSQGIQTEKGLLGEDSNL